MSTSTDLTVRKSLHVAVPPERAWEVFVERTGEWWPMQTHSQAHEEVADVRILDGVMVEVLRDGSTGEWADVIEADAPRRLVLSWRVNPQRSRPTRIEVTFAAEGDGTRVELVHSGWEAQDDGVEASSNYRAGWEAVLGRFAEHAAR